VNSRKGVAKLTLHNTRLAGDKTITGLYPTANATSLCADIINSFLTGRYESATGPIELRVKSAIERRPCCEGAADAQYDSECDQNELNFFHTRVFLVMNIDLT
jgi:hypothetical protein